MLPFIEAQIWLHQLAVPIEAEEVFQEDTHQLFRLALREYRGQNIGEMALRFLKIKTNHGAKIRKIRIFAIRFTDAFDASLQ
jgi:hypothetical protein